MSSEFEPLPSGAHVEIRGTGNPAFNGKPGVVHSFDQAKGRYRVDILMDEDKPAVRAQVRPEHVFSTSTKVMRICARSENVLVIAPNKEMQYVFAVQSAMSADLCLKAQGIRLGIRLGAASLITFLIDTVLNSDTVQEKLDIKTSQGIITVLERVRTYFESHSFHTAFDLTTDIDVIGRPEDLQSRVFVNIHGVDGAPQVLSYHNELNLLDAVQDLADLQELAQDAT